jgi:hypothetical protein
MNKLAVFIATILTASVARADLGLNYPAVTDSQAEHDAKAGASGLGVTTIYDHPTQAPNGQFYVPVEYNRVGDPAAGEQDPNAPHNTTDIDYVPLSQLKGSAGAAGAQGTQGVTGSKGDTGAKGKDGKDGKDGRDGVDANINNNLFLNVGLDVRWYDWKYVSLNSGYRYDVKHYNHTVDIAVVQIKLGRSYEQRELDELKRKLGLK